MKSPNSIEDLLDELEAIRNQLHDFPDNAEGKTLKELIVELNGVIENLKLFSKEQKNIPHILAQEDLPDDEDL